MALLVTGAGGFLSKALIPRLLEQGNTVYGLYHKPPKQHIAHRLLVLVGDITKEDLGLKNCPPDIDAIYHLAGIHRLGEDKDGSIWRTNAIGTYNVLEFCSRYKISHLYFTSTAYTWECNTYGLSKIKNEEVIKEYVQHYGLKATIFKPSIVMGTAEHPYPGHFSQFVSTVVKIHHRAEIIRRKLEGTLRLPIIEPVFRIKGNPDGKLNLVSVDAVIKAMATIKKPGTYWPTNPNPPTLGELAEWVSEFIMVRLKFEPAFKPTPIELMFQKMASAFSPYLWGDDFPSHLKTHSPITKDFIQDTIRRTLLS